MHGDVNEVRTTVVDACEGMSEEEEFPSDLSSPFAIGTIGCSGAPTSRGISRVSAHFLGFASMVSCF